MSDKFEKELLILQEETKALNEINRLRRTKRLNSYKKAKFLFDSFVSMYYWLFIPAVIYWIIFGSFAAISSSWVIIIIVSILSINNRTKP